MKILAFSTKQNIKKKNVLARFSESKGGHGRVWNKILYVTRDESKFFSWVVTAQTHPREKSATFAPCYIMYYFALVSKITILFFCV